MCGKKAWRCLISCNNDLNSSIRELSPTSPEWPITCIFLSPFCCAVDSVNELSVPVALLTRYAPIYTKPWLTLFFFNNSVPCPISLCKTECLIALLLSTWSCTQVLHSEKRIVDGSCQNFQRFCLFFPY